MVMTTIPSNYIINSGVCYFMEDGILHKCDISDNGQLKIDKAIVVNDDNLSILDSMKTTRIKYALSTL
jgi:hypothetical protein